MGKIVALKIIYLQISKANRAGKKNEHSIKIITFGRITSSKELKVVSFYTHTPKL
jgi:hypothetical protein